MAQSRPIPTLQLAPQTKCGLIAKNYELVVGNKMVPALDAYKPFLGTVKSEYDNPIGGALGYSGHKTFGSCFPVAPGVVLTAKHSVFNDDLLSAGYELTSTIVTTSFDKIFVCTALPSVFKGSFKEFDPVDTSIAWGLPRDYLFLKVMTSAEFPKFLLPQTLKEGDKITCAALRPQSDASVIADVKYALVTEFAAGGLTIEEAEARVASMGITYDKYVDFIEAGRFIQGSGEVLKKGTGLFAHTSPTYRGMSGTFCSTDASTFGGIAISAGYSALQAGSTYNVGVGVDRDDFRQDYAAHVLPNLPKEYRLLAERFLSS